MCWSGLLLLLGVFFTEGLALPCSPSIGDVRSQPALMRHVVLKLAVSEYSEMRLFSLLPAFACVANNFVRWISLPGGSKFASAAVSIAVTLFTSGG